METLVLDFNYQPSGKLSWERAVTQWYKGRVEILESYADREVKSVSFSMKMPAVVRELTRYRRKNAVKFSPENVYIRDRGRCQYCNQVIARQKATYDHVLPRSQGGKTKWDNIVISCLTCNQKKRNRTPEQAGMKLLTDPVHPTSLPNVSRLKFIWRKGMPDEWKSCLMSIGYCFEELECDAWVLG